MDAKAGEHRRSELPGLDVTISARYHWSVARQSSPIHYVIGISGILPYNRNVTLQTLELFSAYARFYNAAASPASCLRSAVSLATINILFYIHNSYMYIYLELRTIKLRNYLVSLLPLLTLECLYYAVVLESANF